MSAVLKFLAAARSLANQGLSKKAIEQFAKNEFGEISELLQRQIDNIFKPGKGITSIKKDPDFDDTVIQMQIDEFGPFNPKNPLKNLKKQTEGLPSIKKDKPPKDEKAQGGRAGFKEGEGIMMAGSLGDEKDDISREMFGKPVKDLNPDEFQELME